MAKISKFTLMHKDVPVAETDIETDTGAIVSVGKISDMRHMPVGTVGYGEANPDLLKDW